MYFQSFPFHLLLSELHFCTLCLWVGISLGFGKDNFHSMTNIEINFAYAIELAECTDGAVRLVNGSSSLSGRLEVCAFSVWGTVCDDAFNSNAATVACRQLGLGKSV